MRLGLFLVGAFIGAPTRYLIDQYFRSYMKFPAGILIVNVLGAFLLGVVATGETNTEASVAETTTEAAVPETTTEAMSDTSTVASFVGTTTKVPEAETTTEEQVFEITTDQSIGKEFSVLIINFLS